MGFGSPKRDMRSPHPAPSEPPPATASPRRLRRLGSTWGDRDGIRSYLITACVQDRHRVLATETVFQNLVGFLRRSPAHYGWFGRRFVIMPDHLHLIARQGRKAAPLGAWVKALKAIVPDRVSPSASQEAPSPSVGSKPARPPWRWQAGFHDHKFLNAASEARKWTYLCPNPVRAGLVDAPEKWPFAGEFGHEASGNPGFVRGAPPILETGLIIKPEIPWPHDKTA